MWSADLKKVRDRFEAFGRTHEEGAKRGREERRLPPGLWEGLAQEGLFRSYLQNGPDHGLAYAAAAIEGVSHGLVDGGVGISLISHMGLCMPTIALHARSPLRERYLDEFVSGKSIAAFATAEPHGGSDAQKLTTRLKPTSSGYLLSGEKWSITNAPVAAVIITTGREIETRHPISVVVDPAWPGVERHTLKPAGIRSSPTGRVVFHEVEVPESHVLGKVGDGLDILFDAFTRERILAPFVFIGLMERLCDESFSYTQRRNVFEKPIAEFQYVRRRLTDMKIALETTRAMAHRALDQHLRGGGNGMETSMAKMYSAEKAMEVFANAIKIFGSHRIQQGDLDDLMMASLAGSIAGGTEEMHREVIYQAMYREYRRRAGNASPASESSD